MRCLLFVLALTPAVAAAQPAPAAGRASLPFGRGLTLGEITREYAQLQRRPRPDSTVRGVDPSLGIQGLVVDETATPQGRSFYEAFYLVWSPPPAAMRVTVTLSEQPLPGNSTAVIVRADGEVIFQGRLPRRPDEIADLAAQVAPFVAARIGGG